MKVRKGYVVTLKSSKYMHTVMLISKRIKGIYSCVVLNTTSKDTPIEKVYSISMRHINQYGIDTRRSTKLEKELYL